MKQRYNRSQIATRNVVERTFAAVKDYNQHDLSLFVLQY